MNNACQPASQTIRAQSAALAQAIVTRLYSQQPLAWQKPGATGHEKSLRDVEYHLAFLREAIEFETPALFTNYIAWVKVLFDGLKFSPDAVSRTLAATRAVLNETLTPEMAALVDEYIAAGYEGLSTEPPLSSVYIDESLPFGGLAKEVLDAMLRGDRHGASQRIMDSAASGSSVKDLYLHVLQPVQYEVGRLWQSNQISLTQEHYCTFVTQLIMSQLSPQLSDTKRINRRMVATCVGGETHEVGMRMVTDFFEMGGWDTFFLSANTPSETILRTLIEHRADLLAISATLTIHVSQVAGLIAKVRANEACRRVKILVGGYPFNISDTLWRSIGADGYGRDAQQALVIANQMLAMK